MKKPPNMFHSGAQFEIHLKQGRQRKRRPYSFLRIDRSNICDLHYLKVYVSFCSIKLTYTLFYSLCAFYVNINEKILQRLSVVSICVRKLFVNKGSAKVYKLTFTVAQIYFDIEMKR